MKYDDLPNDSPFKIPADKFKTPPCAHGRDVVGDEIPAAFRALGFNVLYIGCQRDYKHAGLHQAVYDVIGVGKFAFQWDERPPKIPAVLASAHILDLTYDESGFFKAKPGPLQIEWQKSLPVIIEVPKLNWIPPTA